MSPLPPCPLRAVQDVAVLCDASPAALNAGWRAALVARDLAVPLKLLYQAPASGANRLPAELAALHRRIVEQLGCDVRVQAVAGDPLRDAVPLSRAALLVVPSKRGNPVREFILGTQTERVIRLARGPVLVVKQPARTPYRRVFAALDFGEHSSVLLSAATTLARGEAVAAVHALARGGELALAELDASPEALRHYRLQRASRARAAIEALGGPGGAGVRPIVVLGPAAPAIVWGVRAARADLLVIGKRRRGLLADFFLGSVTREVLAGAAADALVVPLRGEHARATESTARSYARLPRSGAP